MKFQNINDNLLQKKCYCSSLTCSEGNNQFLKKFFLNNIGNESNLKRVLKTSLLIMPVDN